MRKLGIRGVRRGKPCRSTVPGPGAGLPEDLVRRDFSAPAPKLLWLADLTYVRLRRGGFAYTFVIDAFARAIVGWAVSASLSTEVCLDAPGGCHLVPQGRQRRPPRPGPPFHSERLAQYTSHDFRNLAKENGVVLSLSRKGEFWDNAIAESFLPRSKESSSTAGPGRPTPPCTRQCSTG
jgi:putative transposase